MKKIILFISTTSLCIGLCFGCASEKQTASSAETLPSETSVETSVIKKQTDADITIPSILIGDELSEIRADIEIIDNNDGTETFSLKGSEIDNILTQISSDISNSIQEILDNDDYYPNITSITHSDDYTSFTITMANDEINVYESMLVMSFYTIGIRYQIYNGVPSDKAVTTVIYINDSDGTVISQSTSSSADTFFSSETP